MRFVLAILALSATGAALGYASTTLPQQQFGPCVGVSSHQSDYTVSEAGANLIARAPNDSVFAVPAGELVFRHHASGDSISITRRGGVAWTLMRCPAIAPPPDTTPPDTVVTPPDTIIPPPPDTTPAPPPDPSGSAELPRVYVNDSPENRSNTVHVSAGANLQNAINNAPSGSLILLPAGATYNVSSPITIGSNKTLQTDVALPPHGTRVSTGANFARINITTNGEPAVRVTGSNVDLIGIEIGMAANVTINYALVELTGSNIMIDRSYIHGHGNVSFTRCVAANASGSIAIVNSYISECHADGFDSQAIAAWDATGPFKILNNYLEGAGENIMFGGAGGSSTRTPMDIEIRRNHVRKPMSWKGGRWSIKNLFELKSSRYVLIEANVFENSWRAAQDFGITLKSSNDEGQCNQCGSAHIVFRLNEVINVEGGINLIPCDAYSGGDCTPHLEHVVIENNHFTGINYRVTQTTGDLGSVLIDHNSFESSSQPGAACMFDGQPMRGPFVLTNNRFPQTQYGCFGSSYGEGNPAFAHYLAPGGYTLTGNVFPGASSGLYPAGNYFSASAAPASVGADLAAIAAATAGVR